MTDFTQEMPANRTGNMTILGNSLGALVDAVSFAGRSHNVRMLVPDASAAQRLREGRCDFDERGLSQQLVAAQADDGLSFVTNLHRACHASEVSLVWAEHEGVGNTNDLAAKLTALAEEIAAAEHFHLVVIRSLLAPGTMERLVRPLLERESGKCCGEDFGLCYAPEVIRPGVALADFRNPVRMLVGAGEETSADAICSLFRGRIGEVVVQEFLAAETTRYADLMWQKAKLDFADQLAELCHEAGVSRRAVIDGFKRDSKQNISACYLVPGCPTPEVLDERVDAMLDEWMQRDTNAAPFKGVKLVSG